MCQLYTDASAALSIAKKTRSRQNEAYQCEEFVVASEIIAEGITVPKDKNEKTIPPMG